jgi:hypothetical protein
VTILVLFYFSTLFIPARRLTGLQVRYFAPSFRTSQPALAYSFFHATFLLLDWISDELVDNVGSHSVLGARLDVVPGVVQSSVLEDQDAASLGVDLQLALLVARQERCGATIKIRLLHTHLGLGVIQVQVHGKVGAQDGAVRRVGRVRAVAVRPEVLAGPVLEEAHAAVHRVHLPLHAGLAVHLAPAQQLRLVEAAQASVHIGRAALYSGPHPVDHLLLVPNDAVAVAVVGHKHFEAAADVDQRGLPRVAAGTLVLVEHAVLGELDQARALGRAEHVVQHHGIPAVVLGQGRLLKVDLLAGDGLGVVGVRAQEVGRQLEALGGVGRLNGIIHAVLAASIASRAVCHCGECNGCLG